MVEEALEMLVPRVAEITIATFKDEDSGDEIIVTFAKCRTAQIESGALEYLRDGIKDRMELAVGIDEAEGLGLSFLTRSIAMVDILTMAEDAINSAVDDNSERFVEMVREIIGDR